MKELRVAALPTLLSLFSHRFHLPFRTPEWYGSVNWSFIHQEGSFDAGSIGTPRGKELRRQDLTNELFFNSLESSVRFNDPRHMESIQL